MKVFQLVTSPFADNENCFSFSNHYCTFKKFQTPTISWIQPSHSVSFFSSNENSQWQKTTLVPVFSHLISSPFCFLYLDRNHESICWSFLSINWCKIFRGGPIIDFYFRFLVMLLLLAGLYNYHVMDFFLYDKVHLDHIMLLRILSLILLLFNLR